MAGIFDKLGPVLKRYEEIEVSMALPEVATDFGQIQELAKERAGLENIVDISRRHGKLAQEQIDLESMVRGETDPELFGAAVPIASRIGDQSATLFEQACFQPGMVKNTYGTTSFLLMQTDEQPVPLPSGLITTVGWQREGQQTQYALERERLHRRGRRTVVEGRTGHH